MLMIALTTSRNVIQLTEALAKYDQIQQVSLLLESVCYDKSYTSEQAAFVRPRLSHLQSFMKDKHASLLISHIVQDIQRPRPIIDDESSGRPSNITAERSNEESQEEYDSEISCDDESSSDSDTSYERTEASTDPTSAQSSYVSKLSNLGNLSSAFMRMSRESWPLMYLTATRTTKDLPIPRQLIAAYHG
ncbi:hypothetical protein DFS33DRAFT_112156 [Desarmillaria ectypa]|nr:hypothetical protein DFS33DRAFT_112156 [Desarmillaria ectypa]